MKRDYLLSMIKELVAIPSVTESAEESASIIPLRRIISSIPLHRQISPPVESANSTAAPAPCKEAEPVDSNCPFNAVNRTDITSAAAHSFDIFVKHLQ